MVGNPLSFIEERSSGSIREPTLPINKLKQKPHLSALGLLRISTPNQSEYSLDVQREAVQGWADENCVFIDDWLVLKKSAKKIITDVIKKTKELKPDYLLVYRIDRLIRTGKKTLDRMLNAIHPPTILVSVSEGVDSERRLERIKELVYYASLESEAISKRTKDAMKHVEGDVGRPPVGMIYKNGRRVKNKTLQKTIRNIKKMARKGLSCEMIAKKLNMTHKNKWTAQKVWTVLNPPRSR